MAGFRHEQTIIPLRLPKTRNSPRLGRPTTSLVDGLLGDSDGQRDAESQQPISVPLCGESESTYEHLPHPHCNSAAGPVPARGASGHHGGSVAVSGVRRIRRAFGGVALRPDSPDHNRAKPERSSHAHRIHHTAAGDADRDRRHLRRIRSTRGRPGRVLRREGQRRRRRPRNRAVPPHAPTRGAARRPAAVDRRRRPLRVQGSAPGRRARRSSPTSRPSRPRRLARSPR